MDTHSLPQLKIAAADTEDLDILAAHVQDSLIPLHSMHFNKTEGTFSSLCNRFCWEHGDQHFFEDKPLHHRVHSGLTFKGVEEVHHRGFNPKTDTRTLNLLTVKANPHPKGTDIHLIFSGKSEIRLKTKSIDCRLGDLHHPWPTHKKPEHDVESESI